jgi:hypothetical protein
MPKEKSDWISRKFYSKYNNVLNKRNYKGTKRMAIIAVDEVIKSRGNGSISNYWRCKVKQNRKTISIAM